MYGMSSVKAAHAPNAAAYFPPFGTAPTIPRIQSPSPTLTPMISESRNWPLT